MHSPVLHSVDNFTINGRFVELTGWAFGRPPIGEIEFVVPGASARRHKLTSYGMPSPDVARAFGADAASHRFRETVEHPNRIRMCDLVNSSLELTLASGEPLQLPICDVPLQADAVSNVSLGQLSLGIGVTTYNRRESLSYTLDKIQQHTRLPYTLVVADDGSSDGTGAMVSDRDINLIGGPNRGIAWNKNRCLFYLKEVKNCDVIILIEDDVYPNSDGWEMEWILASFAYGHVNSLPSWLKDSARGGSGKWHKPYLLHDKLSGQCAAFSAPTLSWVGYVDTRFKQFGHEHVEHTLRMVRAGFGGYPLEPEPRSSCFYAIDGDIRTSESVSHTSPDSVEANFKVFEAVWDESVYRPAWRGDHEYRLLRNEIAPAMPPPRSLRSNTVTKPKARHRAARKAIAWPFVNGF